MSGETTATVESFAHAVPTPMDQASLWTEFFADHYGGSRTAARVFAGSGIRTRHGVVDPRVEDIRGWGTAARMERFLVEGLPLGKEAVSGALAGAGVDASEVGLFVVASCTGYATPGLDILLARDVGMSPAVQRLHIGHMGCYAAIPALGAAADFVRVRRQPAVVLCIELTSLHAQPAPAPARRLSEQDLQQVVAHALFSDAAAAVVLVPDGRGPAVLDVSARTDSTTADHMTWDVTDLGFRMGLSPRVPDVLSRHVGPVVGDMLARHGIVNADVGGWAVHPGGPRILDVVSAALGIPPSGMTASVETLRDYGNCSSATVLLVLERLLAEHASTAATPGGTDRAPAHWSGPPMVAMAFGPGLTLYTVLLG